VCEQAALHSHLPLPAYYDSPCTETLNEPQMYGDDVPCIVLAHNEGGKQLKKHLSIKRHHFRDQTKS